MEAAVVIGANYGDEGKGLITDYLVSLEDSPTLVVRFNGGAQAGHTVQRPDGFRHVFSHFSSGTAAEAQTYLSDFFIANPILFKRELDKLKSWQFSPKVTIHPDCIVTTPYDMYINQVFEEFQGENRHGSCGIGISETIERNSYPGFQLTVKDLFNQTKSKEILYRVRDEWLELRLSQLIKRKLKSEEADLIYSDDIFEYFLKDIEIFLTHCDVADYSHLRYGNRIIFEGAQGLLLDQAHPNFPHVTRSNTGLQNISSIAGLNNINHLDIFYVTRCYLTRHGAGPLPNELPSYPCSHFKDETNINHKFQGPLRFAPLNIDNLKLEIAKDLSKLSANISTNVTLAVTCLDQFEDTIPIAEEAGRVIALKTNDFISHLLDKTKFDNYLFSYGPTRENCKPIAGRRGHGKI